MWLKCCERSPQGEGVQPTQDFLKQFFPNGSEGPVSGRGTEVRGVYGARALPAQGWQLAREELWQEMKLGVSRDQGQEICEGSGAAECFK